MVPTTTPAAGGVVGTMDARGLVLKPRTHARTHCFPAELCSRSYRVKRVVPRGALVAMLLGLSPLSGFQTNGTHQWLTVGREEPAARVSAGGKRPTGSRSRKRQRPRRLGIAQARPPVAAASQLWGSRRLTVPGDGPGRWREQPRQKWGSPEACRVHKIFPRSGTLIVQAEELGAGAERRSSGARRA